MSPELQVEPLASRDQEAAAASRGAIWRRVDLHLHTPGVDSFVCPAGSDLRSAEGRTRVVAQYVDQLEAQGIEMCAITDYNGVRMEWYNPIRDEAADRGIVVLPGAEVSFSDGRHGLHVLAVFNADTDAEAINTMLLSLDRNPTKPLFDSDRSHRKIDPRDNIAHALDQVRKRLNCLLVFPHPDQANGICKTYQPIKAAKLLDEIKPDAIEHCPASVLHSLTSTDVLPTTFFENLAQVEFSDAKSIPEIGKKKIGEDTPRATYVKLSATDVDALRLALHDPRTRVAVGSPPAATHARVLSMKVKGSGFLGNLEIPWNDDLNVVIGGRGSGKSAVLETLRYAFDLSPYSEREVRSDLVGHALGSGGKVTIEVERPIGDGAPSRYRVERILGEEPRVFEHESSRRLGVTPVELFGPNGGPAIFGQREIYAVSGSEEYRLRLLDELIGDEAKERAKKVREALERLRANGRAILDRKKQLDRRDEYVQRLTKIDYEISIYEKHGAAAKLQAHTSLRSDYRHLEGGSEAAEKSADAWRHGQREVLSPLATARRTLRSGRSSQKEILNTAEKVIEDLETRLRELFEEGERRLEGATQDLNELEARWKDAVLPLEEELNAIKREAQTDALDPDRLLKLTDERAGFAPLIDQFERVEQELSQLRDERTRFLQTVRDRRHEEHGLRRVRAERIEELVDRRLKLEVDFKGQKKDYANRLRPLLKGSGVSAEAIDALVEPEATDGIALAEAIARGTPEVQKQFGITRSMADRLVKWFTDDESRLFELETLIPADDLRVALVIDGKPRPLDRLSPGQRATAILLLLFAFEGRVLVLDQPEDDLDNRFVYEDVVQILREQKGLRDSHRRRQVIAATHNPNIPVLGDAELVLPLESRRDRAVPLHRGSIDDGAIRKWIKAIMEGGEEAFKRRAEKYGALPMS